MLDDIKQQDSPGAGPLGQRKFHPAHLQPPRAEELQDNPPPTSHREPLSREPHSLQPPPSSQGAPENVMAGYGPGVELDPRGISEVEFRLVEFGGRHGEV